MSEWLKLPDTVASIGAAVSVLNANLNAHFPAAPVSAEFVREVIDG